MANEFVARKGLTVFGNTVLSGSLTVSGSATIASSLTATSISGSFSGSGANIYGVNAATLTNVPVGVVSSSTQVKTLLPAGTVSSSVQINTGSFSGSITSASFAANANLLDGYDSATTATANTIALRDNDGNVQFNRVGIGGTPSYDLHISKTTSPSIYLESGNDDSKIYLTDTTRYIAGIGGSAIGIYTNSDIRGRYDLYGTRVYGALGVGLTPDVGWAAGEIRATGNITAGQYLVSNNSTGDEGGEILLAKPQTNSTIAGTGVTIDVFQNRLRIFEQGGTARGGYWDITTLGAGASTNLTGGSGTVTSVTAGSGLTGGTITGAGTITLDTGSAHFTGGVAKVLVTSASFATTSSAATSITFTPATASFATTASVFNGPVLIVNTPTSGSIRLGDITTGTTSTDTGLALPGQYPAALFTEVSGSILSYAINTSQIGTRNTGVVGGIFRLDTRTGVFAGGAQSFVVFGVPTGGSELSRIVVSLQDGTTALVPNGGNVGVGITSPSAKLHVSGNLLVSNGIDVTGSLFVTGSQTTRGPVVISGSLNISGSVTASNVNLVLSGNPGPNTLLVLETATNKVFSTSNITASLFGTASNATSASFAVSASWAPSAPSAGASSIVIDSYTFTGNGSVSNYTLDKAYDISSLTVTVGGLTQTSTIHYTLASTTLSFLVAPPSQSSIFVRAIVNVSTGSVGSFSGSLLGTASNVAGGTTNYIPRWSSTTALSSSVLFQSASNLGINTTTPSASFHVVGTTILQGVIERVNITASAPPTTLNFDALSGSVFYLSGSSANNWTINFRGSAATSLNSMMYPGQSMTFAVLVNHASVGYTASVHQVDGTAITPRWQGGTLPSGSGTSTDIYSYTLIKTANAAFNIFASQTKFA